MAARPESQGSVASASSTRSHQEYLDSLIVPSKKEISRISEKQAEQKRAQRHRQRESIDAVLDAQTIPKPQPQHPHHVPFASRFGFNFGRHPSLNSGPGDDGLRDRAATAIQRTYRGYRARRQIRGFGLDASTRWTHAIREAQWRDMTTPRARAALTPSGMVSPPGKGHDLPAAGTPEGRSLIARQNWKKASAIARHAGGDLDAESSSSSSFSSDSESNHHHKSEEQKKADRKRKDEDKARRKQESKMMGLQYFLEMVDLKHRYGSNLRVYHEEWKRADTNENFFYWLDHGEGKDVDIAACPRERLDREQVRYLSRDERQYYLVNVDQDGRLCWAKNGVRIDTSLKWKDSIHGIVPSDDPTPAYSPFPEDGPTVPSDATAANCSHLDSTSSRPTSSTSLSSSSYSSSSIASADAARYASSINPAETSTKKKISHHLSGATIFNQLLRKTVRKNTWIFVADTSFRLYVGIKNSGAFQHSSFLQGSRISAAGLIRIRNGRLTSLSPLSGHYRPPASNFRAFVRSLKDAGVDMGRVSVSKSYAVLVGLETYIKVRKRASEAVSQIKHLGRPKQGPEDGLVVPEPHVTGEGSASVTGNGNGTKQDGPRQNSESTTEEGDAHPGRDVTAQVAEGKGLPDTSDADARNKMREENKLAVKVMQQLNLDTGPAEPRGQKGDGDYESAGVGAVSITRTR
ncbi:uncharacterized protein C8A04DRAFT_11245 [Dichotomopilus funicola]|uniref:Uncharacterized protein n=1 Tax=Dichotomopilus funicola TaxID=1934379 RepID=A0AAN6V5J4_9PEZI|nr:hypothetical protein C8A04DRAFT_11245 [Dichotomopilus funicola]